MLGTPRLHLGVTTSTNDRARELAMAGAPHGTLVTAAEQTAGRGRQGRRWTAPRGSALLMSLVLRDVTPLVPLAAAVAVVRTCGDAAAGIKWPNDILVEDRKVAGILAEGRPYEGWTVLGIGVNVAVLPDDFPPELQETAATLGLARSDVEPFLEGVLWALEDTLSMERAELVEAWRAHDALSGRDIAWNGGTGIARGIDGEGRLLAEREDGTLTVLDAGEVHLGRL